MTRKLACEAFWHVWLEDQCYQSQTGNPDVLPGSTLEVEGFHPEEERRGGSVTIVVVVLMKKLPLWDG